MDKSNFDYLNSIAPQDTVGKIHLFLEFAAHSQREEMPDPYFGLEDDFEDVVNLVEEASRGLVKKSAGYTYRFMPI